MANVPWVGGGGGVTKFPLAESCIARLSNGVQERKSKLLQAWQMFPDAVLCGLRESGEGALSVGSGKQSPGVMVLLVGVLENL